jgi:hypothetical protein
MELASLGWFVAGAAAALVIAAALVALAVFAAWVLIKRRWRLIAAHSVARSLRAVFGTSVRPTDAAHLLERVSMLDVGQLRTIGIRRRLWRRVGAAERAVAAAQTVGASVGDLPQLTRRLRESATGIDAMLAARPGDGPGSLVLAQQLGQVLEAAGTLEQAAIVAAGEASSPRVASLAQDAADEIGLLAAGQVRARAGTLGT